MIHSWLAQVPLNPNLPKGDPNDPWTPAHADRLEAIRDYWPDSGVPSELLLLIGTLILLVALLIGLNHGYRWFKLRSEPLSQFNKVAKQLGLTRGQRWLLWRIARRFGLPTPMTLLLAPGTLYHHASAWAKARQVVPDRLVWKPIHRIGERLFGTDWVELAMLRADRDRPAAAHEDQEQERSDVEYRDRSQDAPALA